ncbi:MAG: hypothetical protein JJE17_03435 [Peptostreptococcaceae bacterium]|nr:hypothetical protein [Peptostreptococcaceae bacterium]
MDHELEQEKNHDKEHGNIVNIVIDGMTIPIHRGRKNVAEIKAAGGVSLAYDLEQVVDQKLILLLDNESLTIKGNEVFVSHPKDSSSS